MQLELAFDTIPANAAAVRAKILARLERGPATNIELGDGKEYGLGARQRISELRKELRKSGRDIQNVKSGPGRTTTYRLVPWPHAES